MMWLVKLLQRLAGAWAEIATKAQVRSCGHSFRCGPRVRVIGGDGISIGNGVILLGDILLAATGGTLKIGDGCAVNLNSVIDASQGGKIRIGNKVLIGPNVVLRASDHAHDRTDVPIRDQGHTGGRIHVGDGVWIGAGVVITRNVTVGEHSILAAGAVVNRDVPPFTVVAGVPARIVRNRRERAAT